MNLKSTFAALLFSITTLVAPSSFAQSTDTVPEHSDKLSPEAANCLRAMLGGASPTSAPQCGGLDSATKARLDGLASQITDLRSKIDAQSGKIANHERRIKELEGKVGALGDKVADLSQQIADLKEQLRKLREDLGKLTERVTALEKVVGDLKTDVAGLKTRTDGLETRVSALEQKSTVKLSARAGFLVLPALDGSTYSGFSIGPRLTLNLTDKTWLAVDTNLLLAVNDRPFGMNVRGGIGYDFHPNWYVTGGFGTSWVNYDSSLKARAAYLTPDIGLGFRKSWFDASLNVMAGPKFEHGNATFAIGGGLFLGATFF
jgi:uncharacterized coiled-coil protein SlyX